MKICEGRCQEMRSEFWDKEIWVWMDDVFSSCICGRHLDLLGRSNLQAEMDGRVEARVGARKGIGSVNLEHQMPSLISYK